MQKNKLWITAAILSMLVILLYYLSQRLPVSKNIHTQNNRLNTKDLEVSQAVYALNQSISLFSLYDHEKVQLHCEFKINQNKQLIINEKTRGCFEFIITENNEATTFQIKNNFKQYITEKYKEPISLQILSLWNRYYEYRIQLGNLHPPIHSKSNDSQYYRLIFNAIQDLRQHFFSNLESQALFNHEDNIYHFYILNRIDILTNEKLTEKEKAQQLHQLLKKLPEDWQISFGQLDILQDLEDLTASIQARGGNTEELREMRLNLLGTEASQHWETLNQSQNIWKNKVNRYLKERDKILQSNMDDAIKNIVIHHLKEQYFKTPSEQLSITAFENKYNKKP